MKEKDIFNKKRKLKMNVPSVARLYYSQKYQIFAGRSLLVTCDFSFTFYP